MFVFILPKHCSTLVCLHSSQTLQYTCLFTFLPNTIEQLFLYIPPKPCSTLVFFTFLPNTAVPLFVYIPPKHCRTLFCLHYYLKLGLFLGFADQHCLTSSLNPSGQVEGMGSCKELLPTPQIIAELSTFL